MRTKEQDEQDVCIDCGGTNIEEQTCIDCLERDEAEALERERARTSRAEHVHVTR